MPILLLMKLKEKGFDMNYYLTGEKSNVEQIKFEIETNIPIYDISVYANVGGGITEIILQYDCYSKL
jgi:hypothetical protein